MNVLDAINWITDAWKSVSVQTIVNCFRKVGFGERPFEPNEEEDSDDLPEILRKATAVGICEAGAFEASMDIEEDLSVHEGASESWEADLTLPQMEDGEDVGNQEQDEASIYDQPPTTRKELNEAMQTMKKFFVENSMLDCLDKFSSFQYQVTRELLFRAPSTRQSTLDSWCVATRD